MSSVGDYLPLSLDDLSRSLAYNEEEANDWLSWRGCVAVFLPEEAEVHHVQWLHHCYPPEFKTKDIEQYVLPELLQTYSRFCRSWSPDNSAFFEGDAPLFHFDLIRALTFSSDLEKACSTSGREPAAIYDHFFQIVAGDLPFYEIIICQKPKWSLRGCRRPVPAQDPSTIVPDTVFSARVTHPDTSIVPQDVLEQLTMEYDPSPMSYLIHGGCVNVPLFIIEYVKTLPDYDGWQPHKRHLLMAMSSAIGLYRTLGLSFAVYGLLVWGQTAFLIAGWDDGIPRPPCPCGAAEKQNGFLYTNLSSFDFREPLDALRLRLMLCKLQTRADDIRDKIQGVKLPCSHDLHIWKQSGVHTCARPENSESVPECETPGVVSTEVTEWVSQQVSERIASSSQSPPWAKIAELCASTHALAKEHADRGITSPTDSELVMMLQKSLEVVQLLEVVADSCKGSVENSG